MEEVSFEYTSSSGPLFREGKQFPPADQLERLAKNERMKKIFKGKHYEVFHRAQALLQSTPFEEQIKTLYIACNVVDTILTKPADMMFGENPIYESTKDYTSREQQALDRIVRSNGLNLLGQEIVIGAGYRGDSFLKVRFGYQQDYEELGAIPEGVKMEPIIEAIDPSLVFPELSRGSRKRFKAVNIAFIEWIDEGKKEVPYLRVERHLAGIIEYKRFRCSAVGPEGVYTKGSVTIPTFMIEEQIGETRYEVTGYNAPLVFHVPYKTIDDEWQGIGTLEKIEHLVAAVNDRLAQIDYILMRHSDPSLQGPDLEKAQVKMGGKYFPRRKDEPPVEYITWDGNLDAAFKHLDYLLGQIFQISETPQWLFGTTIAGNDGGTGTSHTDGAAIKARFMPILTKVNRIRNHVDKAFRDALYAAQIIEIEGNMENSEFDHYTPQYPKILWKDGLPENEKEQAEIMQIRTGGKPTIDQRGAIKKLDDVSDEMAEQVIERIDKDAEKDATVEGSVFNDPDPIDLDEDSEE